MMCEPTEAAEAVLHCTATALRPGRQKANSCVRKQAQAGSRHAQGCCKAASAVHLINGSVAYQRNIVHSHSIYIRTVSS